MLDHQDLAGRREITLPIREPENPRSRSSSSSSSTQDADGDVDEHAGHDAPSNKGLTFLSSDAGTPSSSSDDDGHQESVRDGVANSEETIIVGAASLSGPASMGPFTSSSKFIGDDSYLAKLSTETYGYPTCSDARRGGCPELTVPRCTVSKYLPTASCEVACCKPFSGDSMRPEDSGLFETTHSSNSPLFENDPFSSPTHPDRGPRSPRVEASRRSSLLRFVQTAAADTNSVDSVGPLTVKSTGKELSSHCGCYWCLVNCRRQLYDNLLRSGFDDRASRNATAAAIGQQHTCSCNVHSPNVPVAHSPSSVENNWAYTPSSQGMFSKFVIFVVITYGQVSLQTIFLQHHHSVVIHLNVHQMALSLPQYPPMSYLRTRVREHYHSMDKNGLADLPLHANTVSDANGEGNMDNVIYTGSSDPQSRQSSISLRKPEVLLEGEDTRTLGPTSPFETTPLLFASPMKRTMEQSPGIDITPSLDVQSCSGSPAPVIDTNSFLHGRPSPYRTVSRLLSEYRMTHDALNLDRGSAAEDRVTPSRRRRSPSESSIEGSVMGYIRREKPLRVYDEEQFKIAQPPTHPVPTTPGYFAHYLHYNTQTNTGTPPMQQAPYTASTPSSSQPSIPSSIDHVSGPSPASFSAEVDRDVINSEPDHELFR
ncbi:hypothetical protein AJ80_08798 [Polytolypa hystricis UAMH7299]|uniref:Uncharacterized protein n=1 Tax=Polytolypa hystricis (strain UAMH7299) TaxID=1447883 RepID=A0A2B7X2D4_POLH7|nr:hypothetical protein AJ80_08798 [Polytolypa hystricis UAMH7299]